MGYVRAGAMLGCAALAFSGGDAIAASHHRSTHGSRHHQRHHRLGATRAKRVSGSGSITFGSGQNGILTPVGVHASFPPAAHPKASTAVQCPNVDLIPSASDLAQVRESTLCLVNQERARAGIGALYDNAQLDRAAVNHSSDMVAHDYFSHSDPQGRDSNARILATGYAKPASSYLTGENLAYGSTASTSMATPRAIVAAWMNSPEHRANILNADFRDSGIGVAAAMPPSRAQGQPGATYTQDFGAH